ncbi:uncharacterized protein VICG_01389 [Vittaforma corneae ATCC 50505]|uniref:EF-hand domain-containing protein n=1 Tax=Vittaforma corneae (strain ATCC 50505) TaxID=993615 RepID=L2GLZ9_VITCO|nr:uncharacterized protein VICG_01389 [Vittaforma corneae ATCC 50505]ELA41525.1 hypothetical protein VICG_01389 [Vittaforma corneae ATCC 50505]
MEAQDQFEIFKTAKGDCISRFRQAGYALDTLKEDEIITKEDFQKAIERKDCVSKEFLKGELKKVYKSRMSNENLRKFLKMGDLNFAEGQMTDALRIIPTDEDGSILVDTFIEFLYK